MERFVSETSIDILLMFTKKQCGICAASILMFAAQPNSRVFRSFLLEKHYRGRLSREACQPLLYQLQQYGPRSQKHAPWIVPSSNGYTLMHIHREKVLLVAAVSWEVRSGSRQVSGSRSLLVKPTSVWIISGVRLQWRIAGRFCL